MTDESTEITIDTFTGDNAPAPEALTEEHKTFLEENKANLSDEIAEKYSIEKPPAVVEPVARTEDNKGKGEGEGEDGDEISPEDEETIGKVVDKRLSPLQQRLEQQANVSEVNNFVVVRPEFAPYKESILKHMSHPAYKNIPVDRIAKMVAGDDLIKIGAKKEREAAAKVAATRAGGSSARPSLVGKDWRTATKEEIAAKKAEILGHQGA